MVRSSDEIVVQLLQVGDSIRFCKTSSNAAGFAGAAQLAELRLSMETLRQVALSFPSSSLRWFSHALRKQCLAVTVVCREEKFEAT